MISCEAFNTGMEYVTSKLTDGANAMANPAPADARKCPNNGTLPLFELQTSLFCFSWLFISVDISCIPKLFLELELLEEELPLPLVNVPALRNTKARVESFARNYTEKN
jgi:hypothetical protein